MNNINCKERVEAYFRNMNLYENDNEIRIRFLDKIYEAALDKDYTFEEHEMVLKMLIENSKNCENLEYKILGLCYAYKIKNAINSNVEVPILKSENLIRGSRYDYKELPEFVKQTLIERGNKTSLAFHEATKPDKDALNIFNVYISQDHFYYKGD